MGAEAILKAIETCDVIAIDEVGPMELFSEKFKGAVRKALQSTKTVIAIVHWKARDPLITEARNRTDVEEIHLTLENRSQLVGEIVEKIKATDSKKRQRIIGE